MNDVTKAAIKNIYIKQRQAMSRAVTNADVAAHIKKFTGGGISKRARRDANQINKVVLGASAKCGHFSET